MALTPSQYTTLKNDILSKLTMEYGGSTFDLHLANSNYPVIAEYYNSTAVPNQNIWRTYLPKEEVICEVIMSDYILLTQAQREGFLAICQAAYLNMRKLTIRNSLKTVLNDNSTSYNNIISVSRKKATNFEFLFTVSNVSDVYGYILIPDDIINAMRS